MDFTNLKEFMDSLTDWIIPGNSAVVYKENKKVFSYQSGYSNLEKKIKMQGNELFNIYSCSKIATVVSALQLYEKGKFLLSDPLYSYISEYKNITVKDKGGNISPAKNPITILNLFTMTAGFTYNFNSPAFSKARELTNGNMDTVTVAKCLAEDPLIFNPGERWNYSLCHDVLAALVEVISGQRFSEYVDEHIFKKLDMKDSFYHSDSEYESRMAEQYICKSNETDLVKLQQESTNGGIIENVGKKNSHCLGRNYDSGGAGIITTIEDYAKLASALANGGIGTTGEQILSKDTIDLLRTNQLNDELLKDFNWEQVKGYGYGLGVKTMMDLTKVGSIGSIGEFGWGGAAGATILVDPELNLSIFYAHHMLNPQESYYQPRLRKVLYSCM